MTKVTEHFSTEEFDCHDGNPYPPEWVERKLLPLCFQLEKIRSLTGHPIIILSGYRTKAYNDLIYKRMGKPPTDSMHTQGIAADIKTKGMSSLNLYKAINHLIKEGVLPDGGLGLYTSFAHYDMRGRKARWNYTSWTIT